MKVKCENLEKLIELTVAYTKLGLGFTACTETLVIELTGAY